MKVEQVTTQVRECLDKIQAVKDKHREQQAAITTDIRAVEDQQFANIEAICKDAGFRCTIEWQIPKVYIDFRDTLLPTSLTPSTTQP